MPLIQTEIAYEKENYQNNMRLAVPRYFGYGCSAGH